MIYRSNSPPVRSPPWCELYRVHEVQKKKSWPLEKVLAYMKEGAGTQFDADVVKALMEVVGAEAECGDDAQ